MVKLTPKLISTEFPDEDPQSMQKLVLPGKGIEKIVRLNTCSQLIRLDLGNNSLTSLEGVSQNTTLKWLSAQSNQISSLTGTASLKQLQVLNLGHNQLSGTLDIVGLPALRALMLNDNQLAGVNGLGACPDLNTIILKQNQITELGQSLHGCTALAKLSVANNKLSDVGSALSECSSLTELRVSHNTLASLPQDLSRNPRLKIIEAGGNQIANFQQIQVLSQMPSLHQLNLRGCPIADLPDYHLQLLQQLPMLDVLDSKKVHIVHKSGAIRSAKLAVAGVQSTKQTAQQIAGSQAPAKPDASSGKSPDDSHVKRQKRGLREEESGVPKLKKARKESLAVLADPGEAAHGKGKATVPTVDKLGSNADDADVEKVKKAQKKRKSNAGQRSEQALPVDSSRSFLADVLDPAKPDIATKPAVKAEGHQAPVENVTAVAIDTKASGLVKVVDVQKTTKGKQAKHGKGVESKAEKKKASGVCGSSAGQLLQSGLGLDALQVGLGGSGAWD